MKRFISLFLLVISFNAFAAEEIQVWGRTYDLHCGYFSERRNDLTVTLKDESLAFGTEVKLILGYGGSYASAGKTKEINWEDRKVIEAKAIDRSTWEARAEEKTLHMRTEGRFLNRGQFVLEILEPGQPPRFLNGGTTWGYFETDSLDAGVNCIDTDKKRPEWKKIDFHVVKKD